MYTCTIGWVNLYKKNLKMKNVQFVVNSFNPKKIERNFFKFFWHNWDADLHGFVNICKLPVAPTFEFARQ